MYTDEELTRQQDMIEADTYFLNEDERDNIHNIHNQEEQEVIEDAFTDILNNL